MPGLNAHMLHTCAGSTPVNKESAAALGMSLANTYVDVLRIMIASAKFLLLTVMITDTNYLNLYITHFSLQVSLFLISVSSKL